MAEGARKTVYEALLPIPELGVEPGDAIVIRPGHPINPLVVARGHDRNRLPLLLEHFDDLTPVSSSGDRSRADDGPTLTLIR